MTQLEDAYKKYSDLGFILNRTKKLKKHSRKSGAYSERKSDKFSEDATGYAAIIPPTLIIVDSDSYEEGCMFKDFVKDLGWKPEAFAFTPSGGEHYAFENPYAEKVVGKHRYEKVDIFAGYQSVVPIVGTEVVNKQGKLNSYKWADFDNDEFIVNKWDEKLLDMLNMKDRGENKEKPTGLAAEMMAIVKSDDLDDEEVDRVLLALPTDYDYNTWIEVGMALYDRYSGSDEGKKRFVAFSKRSAKYDPSAPNFEDPAAKWDKGHLVPNKITYKNLLYKADDAYMNKYLKQIDECETKEDFEKLADAIFNTKWFTHYQNHITLIEKIADKLRHARKDKGIDKRLLHVSTMLKNLNNTEAMVASVDGSNITEGTWFDNIILNDEMQRVKYYDLTTRAYYSAEAINIRYNKQIVALCRKMNITAGMSITKIFKLAGGHNTVTHAAYNPTCDEVIFKDKYGRKVLNSFNAESVPKQASEFTPKGRELVNYFVDHLKNIMDEDEANTFLQFLAYTVQNRGEKIIWCPLIQSEQGVGKTVMGDILANHLYGTENCNPVDSNAIVSENNSWALNGTMKILNEVKISGGNRYAIMNALKPLITDKYVTHVEKYMVNKIVRNYANYIAFTNEKNAVALTEGDRRWWLIISKVRSLNELVHNAGKKTAHEYFAPLHELKDSKEYGPELLKYLLELGIGNFDPNFLPESKHKESVIASEHDHILFLSETEDLISSGYAGISEDVISTRQLNRALQHTEGLDKPLQAKVLGDIARRLGYLKLRNPTHYNGEKHSVWHRMTGASVREVKETFKESMKHGEEITTALSLLKEIDEKEIEKEFDV